MKEVRELNKEQIKELENEIKLEFIEREKIIKEEKHKKMAYREKSSGLLFYNKNEGDDINEYFERNLKPKILERENDIINFIK